MTYGYGKLGAQQVNEFWAALSRYITCVAGMTTCMKPSVKAPYKSFTRSLSSWIHAYKRCIDNYYVAFRMNGSCDKLCEFQVRTHVSTFH